MHGQDGVGWRSTTHLSLHMACFKSLASVFNGIKDNEVRRAILNDLHIVMYMLIEPSGNIEAFMNCKKNKIIESFTQHLLNDS